MRTASFSYVSENQITRTPSNYAGVCLQNSYDYSPFGVSLDGRTMESDFYRRGFNGMEKDDELKGKGNSYSTEFRQLDPRLGRWLIADPNAADAPNWTPYRFVFNSPIRYTDPDGQWEVDANGNLKAENGDNAQTLAKFQGIKYIEALKQLKDQGYTVNNKGILNLKVGDQLILNNKYTESISNSTGQFSTDVMMGLAPTPVGSGPGIDRGTPEDNYNCWGSAIAGSQDQKIEAGVGIPVGSMFDSKLSNDYTTTTEANAQFGKTVLRFADASGVQHGAVFYGKNKASEIYVYTKNGWHAKPEVMKLSDLILKIPDYGKVQGINTNESGYYQPK